MFKSKNLSTAAPTVRLATETLDKLKPSQWQRFTSSNILVATGIGLLLTLAVIGAIVTKTSLGNKAATSQTSSRELNAALAPKNVSPQPAAATAAAATPQLML